MKNKDLRPIGIFDSGVGGLTVAKRVRKVLPGENIVYFGDTARVPYGNKSRDTIIRFAGEIVRFLVKKDVKMIVVACNTASSFSLSAIRKIYKGPIISVISPGIKEAVKVTRSGRVGVIGTNSTIGSRSYNKMMAKRGHGIKLFSQSCPLFVPLVENKFSKDNIAYLIACKYLKSLKKEQIDTLILGCTHYPILKNVIRRVMGPKVTLVDSSSAVAKEVKESLIENDIMRKGKLSRGWTRCYVSDDVQGFKENAGIFFKEEFSVKKVAL
ncbi:MAG: glutamate racemase [Candidatus Aadella gelida]|nr:glutamate racemase [Candidatus Aadella gelida]